VCVMVGGCFSQRPGPRTLTESTRVFRIVKKGFVVINLVRITEQKIKIKKTRDRQMSDRGGRSIDPTGVVGCN